MTISVESLFLELTSEEREFVNHLFDCGQKRIILAQRDVEAVKTMLHEVQVFDAIYPGGIQDYITKARDLLKKSSEGVNPFSGWIPSVPDVVDVTFNTKSYHEMEREGLEALTHCGFVLVAGGLGERLGYNSIKIGLPTEIISEMTYAAMYIRRILAIQQRSSDPSCHLPFAIMTSENNHELTVNFLKKNHYFGMCESDLYIMRQDVIPSIMNLEGELATDSNGHLIKKPHGHGDVHFCLYRDGIIQTWLEKYDLQHIVFFQDTNTVNFHTMPCVLSVAEQTHCHMISTCVKRRPHEQTGGLCQLTNATGETMLCNVEYNQLEDVLKSVDVRGDYADESGYSPYPGNCNNLCMRIRDYYTVITASNGIVPEFVNPKYKPGSRTEYLQPTRLESLMQDYPKLILQVKKDYEMDTNCAVVTFPRFMAWSPVKNDYTRAKALREKTGFEESPRSGEKDIQTLYKQQMLSVNECPCCNPNHQQRIVIEEDAHIILWPNAGCITEEIHHHIGNNVTIKKGSVFIVRVKNWYIENCTIDGCCILGDENCSPNASIHLDGVTISNQSWKYRTIDCNDEAYTIIYRMRGYVLDRWEECIFECKEAKEYQFTNCSYHGKVIVQ